MKLFLDQCLPRSTASALRSAGVDAVHACHADLEHGAVVTVDARQARVRRLPLRQPPR